MRTCIIGDQHSFVDIMYKETSKTIVITRLNLYIPLSCCYIIPIIPYSRNSESSKVLNGFLIFFCHFEIMFLEVNIFLDLKLLTISCFWGMLYLSKNNILMLIWYEENSYTKKFLIQWRSKRNSVNWMHTYLQEWEI